MKTTANEAFKKSNKKDKKKKEQEEAPEETRAIFINPRNRQSFTKEQGLRKPGGITFETLRRAAMSVHIARICIDTLKEKITKTPWAIKPMNMDEKVDKEIIGKIENLFRYPNKNDTFRTLLDKVLEDLLVLDVIAIEKTRYEDGTLAELYPIDAASIYPVFDQYGNNDIEITLQTEEGPKTLPVSYVQKINSSQFPGTTASGEITAAWPSQDMMRFSMHPMSNIDSYGYGLSPLESVISVVSSILNADNYNGTYFEEGAFPPLILQLTSSMSERDLSMMREYLYQELEGHFHKPAVMASKNEMKVHNLKNASNTDMQFMEYMKFMARLLAAAYGLSGQDIGLTDEVGSKNVAETQKDLSESKGYGSILHLLKEQFNMLIWKDMGYTHYEFDWVAEDNLNPTDAINVYKEGLGLGIFSFNEARRKFKQEPVPEEWADKPMIYTTEGYKPLIAPTPEDQQKEEDVQEIKKSIYTEKYKIWFDDRGYGQPFIFQDIMTGQGFVCKPPVAVNVTSQELECKLTKKLFDMGLNVKPVTKATEQIIRKDYLNDVELLSAFTEYQDMTPRFDSEKWRAKFGGSRKFPYYQVSEFIDGRNLKDSILLEDMKRSPDSYKQAIRDLAQLWLAEKKLVLGDRRSDQYIITSNKRAFGIDYQFEGDKKRWEDTKESIVLALNACPKLKEYFMSLIEDKSYIKNIIDKAVSLINKK